LLFSSRFQGEANLNEKISDDFAYLINQRNKLDFES
jgi:hypothetical protein